VCVSHLAPLLPDGMCLFDEFLNGYGRCGWETAYIGFPIVVFKRTLYKYPLADVPIGPEEFGGFGTKCT